jgi:iron complex outermembrane receptor protein
MKNSRFSHVGSPWRAVGALISGLLFASVTAALAQQTATPSVAPDEKDTVKLERFVVTGSNIPQAVEESFVPVTIFSQEQLILKGATTPIEGVRGLPSFVGGTATEQDSNRGTGAANVNLRGLGSTSTLTLINGRRTGQAFNNVNLLPLDAIERVDVLKDGAAANYGADAIAGVVNFKLLDVAKGTRLRVTYGNTTDKDATVLQAGLVTGVADDKTSIVIALAGYKRNDIYARDREVSRDADQRRYGGNNGGSDSMTGRVDFKGNITTGGPFGNPAITNYPARGILRDGVDAPRSLADYRQYDTNTDRYNFRVLTPAIPGQQRQNYYGVLKHKFPLNVTGRVDFLYSRLRTDNGLASSPFTIGAPEGLPFSPYLAIFETPAAIAAAQAASAGAGSTTPLQVVNFARYRSIELGNRRNFWDEESIWAFAGLAADWRRWHFDAGYLRADMNRTRGDSGFPSRLRLRPEVISGAFNPFARDFSRGSWRSPTTGVTYTWDNAAALRRSAVADKRLTQRGLELGDLRVNGPLFDLPGGEVQFAGGLERRREYDDDFFGPLYNAGDALGLNTGNNFRGERAVSAAYAETILPLVKEGRVPFVHSASLNAAARYEDFKYNSPQTTARPKFESTDWKLALRYQPVHDVVVRATYSTAFRAPLESELFAATGTSFPTVNDPARKPDGSRFTPTGVQTQIQTGGNPRLDPEEAKTWTGGLAWSPKQIKGLFASVDYYRIDKSNIVVVGDGQFILNANWAAQGAGYPRLVNNVWQFDPNATLANAVIRQTDGSLSSSNAVISIIGTNLNLARNYVEGLDYTVSYALPVASLGTLTGTVTFNQFLKWNLQRTRSGVTEDFVGHFVDVSSDAFSPGSIPEWKGSFTLNYKNNRGLETALTANWVDAFLDDPNLVNATFNNGTTVRTVGSWLTYDWIANYDFKRTQLGGWLKGMRLTVGVDNILGQDPPRAVGAFNDGYDTTLHSLRGRFYHVSVTKQF